MFKYIPHKIKSKSFRSYRAGNAELKTIIVCYANYAFILQNPNILVNVSTPATSQLLNLYVRFNPMGNIPTYLNDNILDLAFSYLCPTWSFTPFPLSDYTLINFTIAICLEPLSPPDSKQPPTEIFATLTLFSILLLTTSIMTLLSYLALT